MRTPSTWSARLAGVAAVGVALAVTELFAGLIGGVPSAISSIGALVVAVTPPAVEDGAIALFGTNDKAALAIGTVIIALLIGAVLGRWGRDRFSSAVRGFVAFGVVGVAAIALDPLADVVLAAFVVVLGVVAGLLVLRRLLDASVTAARPVVAGDADAGDADVVLATVDASDEGRRRFLVGVATAGVGSLVAGTVGRLRLTSRAGADPTDLTLTDPVAGVVPPGPNAAFDVPGLTPVVVPNDEFYRIDTALVTPRIDPDEWSLRIHGMVERELTFTLDELYARPQVERYVTIACVSNEVGGDLIGNAAWQGVLLSELLDEAGVAAGASQVVGRSIDGWTAGFPAEVVFDGREPLVALGMNGEPLPTDHGFPARLIVPGLYGYVSATKWLTEIELTTWEDFDGYWVPRGWSKEGPIKLQSRIDVPRNGSEVAAGEVVLAGVAWSGLDGIATVEVAVDDGPWVAADLSEPLSDAAWVQWRTTVALEPGRHRVEVRATDLTGEVQTDELASPRPDGATGHHAVIVRVT